MKRRDALEQWRKAHGLNFAEIASLILITYDAIRKHIRLESGGNIAINYRLFKLTNLEVFKLNQEDLKLYQKSCSAKGSTKQLEHLISEKFITAWVNTGMLPRPEHRLMQNDNVRDKAKLYPVLRAEILGGSPLPKESRAHQTNESIDLKLVGLFLEKQTDGDEKDFLSFIEKNKKDLQRIFGVLNIMLDPEPLSALKTVQLAKQNFS